MTIKDRFLKKTILILGVILVLYTLVGFFLLPVIGKKILSNKLSDSLNREVAIEKIVINPYTLTAAVEALVVKDKNTEVFFSAQKIFVNLSLSSLFSMAIVMSDISLESPYVNIIRTQEASFNFSDLLNPDKPPEKSSENEENTDTGIIPFVLKNVIITGGKIAFTDKAANVSHLVNNFSLSLPVLSSRRKNRYEKSNMDIDFVLNQAKIDIHVESTPFAEDLASQATIKTSDIDVIHYLSYLPIPENVLLKDLDLNLNLKADYRKIDSNDSLTLEGKVNALNADVKGVLEEEIIKFSSLSVELSRSDVLANQLNISKVLVTTPELNVNRDKSGRLNLFNYIPQNKEDNGKGEDKKTADTSQNQFVLKLADFEIKDAAVFFQDLTNERPFKSKIFPLSARIINLEAGSSVSGEYRLKLETESKEGVDSSGRFHTDPVQADGKVHLSNIVFNKYAPYYESLVNCDVQAGSMTLESDFQISQQQDKFDMVFKPREFLIQALSIFDQQSKEEMINIPEFAIKGSTIDVGDKKIDFGTISTQNGKVLLKRHQDDQINIVKSFLPEKESQNPANPPKPVNENHTALAGPSASPWSVTMKSFDAKGFHVKFKDLTNTEPVSVDFSNISIKAQDFNSFSEEKGDIDVQMDWNEAGQISIKGSVIPSILSAGLDIGLEKIDIKSLQPYFTDAIRILVTDGSFHAKGKLQLDMEDKPKTNIQFAGETSITNFICLDKQTAKDFFKCNSLYLSGLDVSVFPVNVKVKELSLTDFYSRIIISDTGEMNLNTIFKNNQDQGTVPEKSPEKTSSETPQIDIESVTLQGGNINFSDFLTRPNFTAEMKQIAGSVAGLSSDEQSRAKLYLQGVHGQSSPLDIVGTINPLAENKFADINISYKDIELTNFTPYSSKYLGYKIEKGKLILDLEYMIDGNKLTSENRVRFDNFELGERVDSEHATSLPVGLAISLLKNRDGQIDLNLPVTGELDDPEFRIGAIVFKMISNLILKVVTSPFSIIGSMFGGGEDLGFVDFQYGEMKIDESNYGKIDTLAQILQEKSSIRLEIESVYDKLRDFEALRIKGFEDLIKATKLKEMILLGSSAATLKDVVIEKEERQLYIHTAYAQAQFPKPRDDAGVEKELDVEEKKKLLITNINIGKDDLRLLAMNRSENIKAYLLSTGKIEKERVFLLEPNESDGSDTQRTSKVNFLLK
ncbi:MAG: DUF748 domain-containing protein [Desulfobacterales bacterium]|nr:DUF748 domain-containing protein [Desulfobacterales bacterium]